MTRTVLTTPIDKDLHCENGKPYQQIQVIVRQQIRTLIHCYNILIGGGVKEEINQYAGYHRIIACSLYDQLRKCTFEIQI